LKVGNKQKKIETRKRKKGILSGKWFNACIPCFSLMELLSKTLRNDKMYS